MSERDPELEENPGEDEAADGLEFTAEDDGALEPAETAKFSEAVLYSSDWTVETVISQLRNKNIEMNPRFQRRDAWSSRGKSRFIESVILGFPIPQIVLAEKKGSRGQFIVLDGKQRLLSLLQFTGNRRSKGRDRRNTRDGAVSHQWASEAGSRSGVASGQPACCMQAQPRRVAAPPHP